VTAPAPAAPAPAARRDPFGFGPPPVAPPPAPELEAPAEEDWSDLGQPAEPFGKASTSFAPVPEPEPMAVPEPEPELAFDVEPPAAQPSFAPIELPEEPAEEPQLAPMHAFVPPPEKVGHKPAAAPLAPPPPASRVGDGGEAALREALSKASLDVIERVVWEVVPQLAETIIRENLERLVQERQG